MAADARYMARVLRGLERMYGKREWQCWGKGIDVLVETVLSQNTSNANSEAGFRQLRRRFKSWKQVAEAPVAEVERHIRVSGLSRVKAPRIQSMLRKVKADFGKYDLEAMKGWDVQRAYEYLVGFEGIGPKTAYCVLMFAFGMEVFPVDTHVRRIAGRLGIVGEEATAEEACEVMTPMIRPADRYAMHVLMIEHGRTTCRARGPKCGECGLLELCPFGQERLKGKEQP
jgi:endonuclease-3